MIVQEAMTKDPVTINAEESVTFAAKLMRKKCIGSLIVVREKQVLGIVTERDLVHRVLASTQNPNTVFMTDVMTAPIVTISQREDVAGAAKLMKEKGIRRLVVMDQQELVGVLTTDDLTRNLMQVVEEFATMLFIMERRTDYDREMIHRVTR
jgi:CBS domain-containing protein